MNKEPKRYGKLTRGEFSHRVGSAKHFHFTCECGTKAIYPMSRIYGGKSNCGCVRGEKSSATRGYSKYAKIEWQTTPLFWRRKQEEKHSCSCMTDEHTGRFKVIEGKEVEVLAKARPVSRDYFLIDPEMPPNEDNLIFVPIACIGHGLTYHNVLLMSVHHVPLKDIAFALDTSADKIAGMIEAIKKAFHNEDLSFLNGKCRLIALDYDQQAIARSIFLDKVSEE